MEKDKLEQYTVTARLINTYEIKVMATDEYAALKSLDEWVAEDFTDYITNQQWDLEAI
jgi:5'(3')-deoxyribonucleotidase